MLGTLFLVAGLSGGTIEPALARHLAALGPDEPVELLLLLGDRYDAAALARETEALPREQRAARVRERLEAHALRSQRDLSAALARPLTASGAPAGARAASARDRLLWIVNARRVTVPASSVALLARQAGVERVCWDRPLALEDEPSPAPLAPPPAPAAGGAAARATPNIIGHQAPQLWSIGIDGSGVLVLNIDSGVAKDHPALAPSLWRNPGEIPGNGLDDDGDGYTDDVWGWDFVQDDAEPYDGGHGTATAGILVGNGAGNGGTATGMAPGATMAVARVSSAGQLLEAYQYAIAIGADCVSSSHSVKWGDVPDYHAFRAAMEMELAAGIVHANSVGNRGLALLADPLPWNIATPANCPSPWRHPGELAGRRSAVLGVGGILLDGDRPYADGSRGPSAWEDVRASKPSFHWPQNPLFWDYPWWNGAGPGLLKPDLAAYTNVRTTKGPGSYLPAFGGTSAATPHVGGAICLLLQQSPGALPRQIAQALQETAQDLEQPGKDTITGAGKLQAYDAALRLRSLVTLLPSDPAPGETFELRVSGPQGAPYLLAAGSQAGATPTPFGVALEIADPVLLWSGTHAGADQPDIVRVRVPAAAALSGMQLRFQTLADDTRGASHAWLVSLLETLTVR